MTAAEWAVVVASCVMTGTLVLVFGLWGVQRRATNRYWGQG